MIPRIERLRESFASAGAGAAVVRRPENVRYLCGFTGSTSALLVRPADAILFTDSRYAIQAHEEVRGAGVEITDQPALHAAVGAARGCGAVGFEADHVSFAEHASLASGQGVPALLPIRGLVEELRIVKDPGEVEAIRASVELNSGAFETALAALADGATEAEIAAELERDMRRRGAASPAFPSIVASGPRGARPHARASGRKPGPCEPVVIDIGAMLNGYASDMTRTVFAGEPGPTGRNVHAAVLEALERAEEEVRDGVTARAVDEVARKALMDAGYAETAYRHGTGHGVGLDVHEDPRIAAGRNEILRAGMVITLEPGVYVEGWGGVRIEDVVVVEEGGCSVLTPTSRSVISA